VGLGQGWSHLYDQGLVAAQQASLAPNQPIQPFLSPPPVAWLVAPLAGLPLEWAYVTWAILTMCALVAAVAWTGTSALPGRLLAGAVVVGTVWVLQPAYLGQVVPLIAAALVVAWRLLRTDHEVAAGLVLALVLLKPNTAFLVPACLLASGRLKTLLTWVLAAAAVAGLALATTGTHELVAYVGQLQHPPPGSNALTLEAALGVGGPAALVLRGAIIGAVLVTAWRLRALPGLVIVLGVIGSLLITPYIHLADLCLLAAAGWVMWQERAYLSWRLPLAASWLVASPLLDLSGLAPRQNRWPLLELGWLVALVLVAWRVRRHSEAGVTDDFGGRTQGMRRPGGAALDTSDK
jgi:Glycosyltransferase family 87